MERTVLPFTLKPDKPSYMEIAEFKMLYDFLQNNLEQSVDQ